MVDHVFIMGYNSQDSIFVGEWSQLKFNHFDLASASADYKKIKNGILSYLNLGVEAEKLVLGVPWYRKVIVRDLSISHHNS